MARRDRRPVIDLGKVLQVCQDDQRAMLKMVQEVVRTTLIHVGSIRNAMMTDQVCSPLPPTNLIRASPQLEPPPPTSTDEPPQGEPPADLPSMRRCLSG